VTCVFRRDNNRTGLCLLATAVSTLRAAAVEAITTRMKKEGMHLNPVSQGTGPDKIKTGAPVLHLAAVQAHEPTGQGMVILEHLLNTLGCVGVVLTLSSTHTHTHSIREDHRER
jgi:hypothetical protein